MGYKHFTKVDRMEISILLKKSYSIRDIAGELGKNPSSVSREIANNKVNGLYGPKKAHHKARVRRLYSKYQGMKVVENIELQRYIEEKLKHWTPEEIAGRLKRENNNRTVISPKSIYRYLYSSYGQYLCQYLPSRQYNPRRQRKNKQKREMIPNRVSIKNRPKVIDWRLRFGDFEGDTLGRIKIDTEAIAGLVERKSRYFLLKKVPRLKYAMDGFKELLNPYHSIVNSLTLDNGVENVRHQELNVPTYFCHPYTSWEKGSIENCFQRLRRFIPKKSSLKNYTDEEISNIVKMMNSTPRKCLDYRTPKEVFEKQYVLATKSLSVALGGKMQGYSLLSIILP